MHTAEITIEQTSPDADAEDPVKIGQAQVQDDGGGHVVPDHQPQRPNPRPAPPRKDTCRFAFEVLKELASKSEACPAGGRAGCGCCWKFCMTILILAVANEVRGQLKAAFTSERAMTYKNMEDEWCYAIDLNPNWEIDEDVARVELDMEPPMAKLGDCYLKRGVKPRHDDRFEENSQAIRSLVNEGYTSMVVYFFVAMIIVVLENLARCMLATKLPQEEGTKHTTGAAKTGEQESGADGKWLLSTGLTVMLVFARTFIGLILAPWTSITSYNERDENILFLTFHEELWWWSWAGYLVCIGCLCLSAVGAAFEHAPTTLGCAGCAALSIAGTCFSGLSYMVYFQCGACFCFPVCQLLSCNCADGVRMASCCFAKLLCCECLATQSLHAALWADRGAIQSVEDYMLGPLVGEPVRVAKS
eukprot:TRINITY_DN81392_c0_g1_i1.p1 TRINITY_DN81392_c0_g1~~TRINITY_DN81392_c0_g1_i1.p1  ORF type:complete len:417 (+),score=38.81 TRINITY_DN81392_c0_g1_i1:141-1391(+)